MWFTKDQTIVTTKKHGGGQNPRIIYENSMSVPLPHYNDLKFDERLPMPAHGKLYKKMEF